MAPRRSGRRNASPYSKGDYIEYQYKGQTVTGKLSKKSSSGTAAKPIWIVTPTDRRRKNEEIPEKALGKVINAQEAMNNRGPKLKKSNIITRDNSHTSNSNSDGSLDEAQVPTRKGGRGSPNDESKASTSTGGRKRKSDDSDGNNTSDKKSRRTVTFSQESNTTSATSRQNKIKKARKAKNASSTRIGTRSTRGSGEAILLPDLPIKRKKQFPKGKKLKKDENVKIVKMLTGTLYIFRGDRPRAEFVRSK